MEIYQSDNAVFCILEEAARVDNANIHVVRGARRSRATGASLSLKGGIVDVEEQVTALTTGVGPPPASFLSGNMLLDRH